MKKLITLTFMVMILISIQTHASTEREREALARLLTELETLEQIIRAAEQSSLKTDRQRFNYTALRQDFALIRSGINQHLHKPRIDPRELSPLTPLSGNYK